MSVDSRDQWMQATRIGISDLHPPIMAWWWRMLNYIYPHPGVLLVFHLAVLWLAIYLLGRQTSRFSVLGCYACLALWLTPSMMIMSSVLWKDTGMTITYLLAFALLLRARLSGNRLPWKLAAAVFLLLLYGTAVRYNSIAALPAMCVLFALALLKEPRWQRVIGLAFALTLVVATSAWLFSKAITEKPQDMPSMARLLQLNHMSLRARDPSLIPTSLLELHNISYPDYIKRVRPHLDFTEMNHFRRSNPQVEADIAASFTRMLHTYPWHYLRYRRDAFVALLALGRYNSYYTYQPNRRPHHTTRYWAERYFKFASTNSYALHLWPYLFASFILLAAALRRWRRREPLGIEVTLLSLSGIFYLLFYFFVTPSSDFRYGYWLVTGCLYGSLLMFSSPPKPEGKS